MDRGGRPTQGRSPGAPRGGAEQRPGDATPAERQHGAGDGHKSRGALRGAWVSIVMGVAQMVRWFTMEHPNGGF